MGSFSSYGPVIYLRARCCACRLSTRRTSRVWPSWVGFNLRQPHPGTDTPPNLLNNIFLFHRTCDSQSGRHLRDRFFVYSLPGRYKEKLPTDRPPWKRRGRPRGRLACHEQRRVLHLSSSPTCKFRERARGNDCVSQRKSALRQCIDPAVLSIMRGGLQTASTSSLPAPSSDSLKRRCIEMKRKIPLTVIHRLPYYGR